MEISAVQVTRHQYLFGLEQVKSRCPYCLPDRIRCSHCGILGVWRIELAYVQWQFLDYVDE